LVGLSAFVEPTSPALWPADWQPLNLLLIGAAGPER